MSKTPLATSAQKGQRAKEDQLCANVDAACMLCGVEKHPLNACRKFNSVSPEQRRNLVREHQLYFNCLHFEHDSVGKTTSQDMKQLVPVKTVDSSTSHSSHLPCPNSGRQHSMLLMAC